MYELLILLLPVAAASGWYAARRGGSQDKPSPETSDFRSDYFKGISYLLNEQPDKAIEVFIKVLEVDSETVETHLALGNLYRRRGEVDRAIRIHQNLIARPTLETQQRDEALLELGQDYMSAGLLDRAENLFEELIDGSAYSVQALRQLIDIYEQEKDWRNAISSARRLEEATGNQLGGVIAQYYCEEADQYKQNGDLQRALEALRNALQSQPGCVRASLLEGDALAERGDFEAAIRAYKGVEAQDPNYLPDTIERLRKCYERIGKPGEMMAYLSHVLERYGGITATLALAEMIRDEKGERAATEFMMQQLRLRPSVRGFHRLLEMQLSDGGGEAQDHLMILKDLTTQLLRGRPVYKCQHCGFPAKSLHWQCPGCKHWSTIKPIQGVEGE